MSLWEAMGNLLMVKKQIREDQPSKKMLQFLQVRVFWDQLPLGMTQLLEQMQ